MIHKQASKKFRNIKKTWSSASITQELSHKKLEKSEDVDKKVKKIIKDDFFPIGKVDKYQAIDNKWIINPDSLSKMIWDVFVLISIMTRAYVIPYSISFSVQMLINSKNAIMFTDIVFIVDVILNFNKAFYFKGLLVTDRSLIIKKYLKKTFIIDLISSLPFQIFIKDSQMNYSGPHQESGGLKYLLLLKFIHLYRIKHTFYQLEDRFTSINSVTCLKFFHFSLLISLLVHWTACLVHLFYLKELKEDGSLWTNYISNESIRYLAYLYYIDFTVTSIGYYALNITTTGQRLIIIAVMCFDIVVFAYILSKIQSTLESYQFEGKETKRLLKKCKYFISQNGIPKGLRHKILKYITFCRENQRKSVDNETQVLNNLSLPLREEIFNHTRGFILSRQTVLKIYQSNFLKFIGYHLKLQIYGPQDQIFCEGENSSIIYFIQSGDIEIYHSSTLTTFKVLKKGKCFGEIGFFLETSRTASAKSVNFAELLVLPRSTFNKILCTRPNEKKQTDVLIEETELKGLSILNIKCYLCNVLGHISNTCKDYQINIDIKKIIKKLDGTEYSPQKKINPNDAYKLTFNRSTKNYFNSKHKAFNTIGKPIDAINAYKSHPSLIDQVLNFFDNENSKIKSKRVSLLEDNSSSSSEDEASPLPANMQYRNAFLSKSKTRINQYQEKNEIELFNFNEELPKIYLESP
jgi:Cyclic nucleotide-binding domain